VDPRNKNAYTILVWKIKRPLARFRRRLDDSIKMGLTGTGYD
jgi:hypothetical protein